jgi:heterotetrameric sarcosine oxidase gamma subunit
MINQVAMEPITDADGTLQGYPGISLNEVTNTGLWSIQSSATLKLESFASIVFDQDTKMGSMLTTDGLRLIQFSPGKAYLFSDQFQFPGKALEFETIATDISHALCHLLLSGDDSLEFLNAYTTVDLEDEIINTTRCVRTRLGQYAITLWWEKLSDIHILVDRSYARSFCTYLQTLSTRWF